LTSDDKEKCDILNNFLSSVFTQEDLDNVPTFKCPKSINTSLQTCSITVDDMKKALEKLNSNKSPGPDNFHSIFLKNSSSSLAKPLTILFNKAIFYRAIQDDWKTAEVRPIFKKGNKS